MALVHFLQWLQPSALQIASSRRNPADSVEKLNSQEQMEKWNTSVVYAHSHLDGSVDDLS